MLRQNQKKVSLGLKLKAVGTAGLVALASKGVFGTLLSRSVKENARIGIERVAYEQNVFRAEKRDEVIRRSWQEAYDKSVLDWIELQKTKQELAVQGEKTIPAEKQAVYNSRKSSVGALGVKMGLSVRFPKNPVSASFIESELKKYDSPLLKEGVTGKDILETARKYNVDPAFFLAVIIRESNCGNSALCRATKNIANIRWTPKATFGPYKGFIKYPSYRRAMIGFFWQINRYATHGVSDVNSVVKKYAPPVENKTAAYQKHAVEYVTRSVGK